MRAMCVTCLREKEFDAILPVLTKAARSWTNAVPSVFRSTERRLFKLRDRPQTIRLHYCCRDKCA